MDLFKDLTNIIQEKYKEMGVRPPKGDSETIIKGYFNLKDKLISKKRRKVLISKELENKQLDSHVSRCLKVIKRRFEAGHDVNIYLSKKAFKPMQKDQLLYDWGIHHLHVNDEFDEDDFIKRSDHLLFFIVNEDKVYFIDVTPHKLPDKTEFCQQDLLKIVKRNWPELLDPFKVDGAIGVTEKLTDKDIAEIRKAGTLAFVELDGEVFILIGGGYSSARTSIKQLRQTDDVLLALRDIERTLSENKRKLNDTIAKYGLTPIQFSFKLIVEDESFYVINEITGNKVIKSESLYRYIFE